MKNVLTALMVVVVMSAASAQKFIPRIGMTVFKLTGEEEDVPGATTSSLVGLTIGLGYQVRLNDRFSLQPEMNFVQKGATGNVNNLDLLGTTVNGKLKIVIEYFEIPVLAKATFGSSGTTKFFVLAGPSLGIGLGGRVKYDLTGSSFGHRSGRLNLAFGKQPENSSSFYINNQLDFGIQGGGGVLFADKVFIDIRYSLGLSNTEDGYSSKNRGIVFTVGMPFRLVK